MLIWFNWFNLVNGFWHTTTVANTTVQDPKDTMPEESTGLLGRNNHEKCANDIITDGTMDYEWDSENFPSLQLSLLLKASGLTLCASISSKWKVFFRRQIRPF